MATCRSVTIAGTRCTKSCVPGSSYCPYHQDRSAVLLLVVGVLLTAVVTYVGIRYADSVGDHRLAAQRIEQRPEVVVSVSDDPERYLTFMLEAPQSNRVPITVFHTKFDIPGTLTSSEVNHSELLEPCTISESFKVGGSDNIWAQTVKIRCSQIQPGAFFRARLYIRRTEPMPVPGSEILPESERPWFNPLMDLHDYSRIEYSWLFNGTEETERTYLDLTHLAYIISDNANLAAQFSSFSNPVALRAMEESRKNW